MKPRMLWLSDSTLFMTGFTTESKELCKRVQRSGWEVYYAGHGYAGQKLSPKIRNGVTLPAAIFEDGEEINYHILPMGKAPYGQDVIQPHIRKYKPEIFGCLLDSFMLYPWIIPLDLSPAKSVMWFPSDGGWFPLGCEKVLQKFNYRVAMAKFGRDQLKDSYGIDCEYIPHGTMPDLYYPLKEQEKQMCKARWGLQDKFVVGFVSRNQGRKMLDRQIKSFSIFAKKNKDAYLLCHSDPYDVASPWNLPQLAERFGVSDRIVWTGMSFLDSFTTTDMRNVYNAMDVHFLLTSGEGFGIPFIEAMSCEIPNVATDYTSSRELITDWDAGLVVPLVGTEERPYPAEKLYDGTLTGSYNVDRGMASIKKGADALQYFYDNRSEIKRMGQNGRKAIFAEYSWEDKVWPRWSKLLNEMMEK